MAGLERENHPGFSPLRSRDAEPAEQERRGDHMAHLAHLEFSPTTASVLSTEFRQDSPAKFDEARRHAFRRKVRPEFVCLPEPCHQRPGLPVHMEDPHRRREYHHTGFLSGNGFVRRGRRGHCPVHMRAQIGGPLKLVSSIWSCHSVNSWGCRLGLCKGYAYNGLRPKRRIIEK